MYKQISIKNLKIFKEEQKLKIAPITLLYGENSSGKTSLLKTFDIVHNIFSEQQVKRGKNVSQKDSLFFRNESIQNISAKKIHKYSNQYNKKDINISIDLDILTNKHNIKEAIFGKLSNKNKSFSIKVNLKIKYFPKKEISKVVKLIFREVMGKV